jgi:hypothetical protein
MWKRFVDQMAGIVEGNPVPTVYALLILFGLGAIGWAI